MKERRVAATDGATLLTDDGPESLTATAIIRLTMLDDHHTRVWCAHTSTGSACAWAVSPWISRTCATSRAMTV